MPDVANLFWLLVLSLVIQAFFFAFASSLRTDKVTDLSYGLTFILIALVLVTSRPAAAAPGVALAGMVVVWGVRLAAYLFYRILRVGRDDRFDDVRDRFWKFLQFWVFQGVAVWVILLPVMLWFDRPGRWNLGMGIGLTIWAAGLGIEAVADWQKFRFKMQPGGRSRWVDAGLWRLSRHPNYFGEMLCWWGIFVFVAVDLGAWGPIGAVGPAALTLILLYGTGIPTLEAKARRKWADDPDYRRYRERTRLLVPWPK